ncbi:hypothetical protein PoB_005931700 [Plakobranchus ocellatus]|uniref:Uncharacterized protein n=1 Tax=Plakobranchus ocellatus TaxID=259542 RepID=A0AAV4CM61_9GAST|nr:hypothetical protein PoB_005931700 [Plakobranchus ocellatus]
MVAPSRERRQEELECRYTEVSVVVCPCQQERSGRGSLKTVEKEEKSEDQWRISEEGKGGDTRGGRKPTQLSSIEIHRAG